MAGVCRGGGGAYATNNTQLTPINFLASQVAACTWSAHAPAAASSGVGCARPSGRVIAWAPIGLAKPAQNKEQREYFIYYTYMHIYCVHNFVDYSVYVFAIKDCVFSSVFQLNWKMLENCKECYIEILQELFFYTTLKLFCQLSSSATTTAA